MINKTPLSKCPKCGGRREELSVSGMMNGTEYLNRHDFVCLNCRIRYDCYNCECGNVTCRSNSLHHATSHTCNECGIPLDCNEAHGDMKPYCGHQKPKQIHAHKKYR
jgi:hypothetical protein